MKNSWFSIYLLAFFQIGWLQLHCSANLGTEIGNPEAVSLNIVGVDGNTSFQPSLRVLSSGVTVTEAEIVLGRISFKPLSECRDEEVETSEIDFEGPYVVDLLNNSTLPDVDSVEIASGAYCKIELRMDRLEADERPSGIDLNDPIVGHSLRVTGQTPNGEIFEAVLEFDEEFRLRNNQNGFGLGRNGVRDFLVVFDLAEWFSNINWSGAVQEGNTIRINQNENQTIQSQLKRNVKFSARLYEDVDRDGEADDDEREEEDLLAEGVEI